MTENRIALFGEAERGSTNTAYLCDSLTQLVDFLGNPPEGSRGLHYAIQALLSEHPLVFVRVEEEGFSLDDYFQGIHLIKKKKLLPHIGAFCLPGVGDSSVIDTVTQICIQHRNILITNEADLYDYLTG